MIDFLLHNARVYTQDPATPTARALAIRGDRIVAVGGDELKQLAGAKTIVENLEGRTVVPGFVDSHIHWQWTSLAMKQVRLQYLATKRECLAQVAEAARTRPPGTWIVGAGWAQGEWTDNGGAFPTAADLDSVAPKHPVYLSARSGHAAWANSEAMRRASLASATADPPGGRLERDAAGNPTGILFEDAMPLVRAHVPQHTIEEIADAMDAAQESAWREGLTAMHDYDWRDAFAAMQLLRERGRLGLRVHKHINEPEIDGAYAIQLRSGFGDDWLHVGGLKMFADGALGSVTALMIEPYEGQPDNRGIRTIEKDRMRERAIEGTRRGFHSTIHAIGDLAVRDVLDILEDTRREEVRLGIPRQARRHRIEHVQLIHPDDVGRLAELDIVASIQPIHATADMDVADRYWGARSRLGYNARVQIDRGVHVVFGSDSPVEPFDPIRGIHAAVTRRRPDGSPGPEGWYPEARVSVAEAIRCYTAEPAWAASRERVVGQLAPNFLADLVVLDRDPHAIPTDELLDVRVTATMVGGAWRWRNA